MYFWSFLSPVTSLIWTDDAQNTKLKRYFAGNWKMNPRDFSRILRHGMYQVPALFCRFRYVDSFLQIQSVVICNVYIVCRTLVISSCEVYFV
jgi:hypothetical protein